MTAPTDPPPNPTSRPPSHPAQRRMKDQKWFVVLAACLAGMMIGYGLSGFAPEAPDWKRDAAQHHALYRAETVADLAPDPLRARTELARVADAIGAPLPLAAGPGVGGLTFLRAQTLFIGEAPLAHILFASPRGEVVSLFVKRPAGDSDSAGDDLTISTRAGRPAALWTIEDAAFLLIGGGETDGLARIADRMATHLRAMGAS